MIEYYKYSVAVEKAESAYMVESALLDIYMEDASNQESLGSKIKAAIEKIIKLFKQFCSNLAHAISNIITQVNLRVKLLHIKDTLYMMPELGKMTVNVHFDPNYRTDYKSFVSSVKNALIMTKERTENTEMYSFLRSIDNQRNHWGETKVMTVSQMVSYLDSEIELLSKDLDETINDIVHFTKLRDYDNSSDVRTFETISSFMKDRNRIHCDNTMSDVNKLLSVTKKKIKETITDGCRLVHVKMAKFSTDGHLHDAPIGKPVGSINVNGKKIDIYKSMGKIEKGTTSGASIHTNKKGSFEYITVAKDFYEKLAPEEQKAVLYHEAGHYINGDASVNGSLSDLGAARKDIKTISKNKNIDSLPGAKESKILYLLYELEADKRAFEMGISKKALDSGIDKITVGQNGRGARLQEVRKSMR